MGRSMSDQYSMFDLTTCGPIVSATSSPGSAAGPTPSLLLDGRTTERSGLGAARVSPSLWRDKERRITTTETSGPLFTVSSPSADLQRSLANRLRENLDINGSPEFVLRWSDLDIGLGPPVFRLASSGRRTGGSGCSGW